MKNYIFHIILVTILSKIAFPQMQDQCGYKGDVFWSANNKRAHLLLNRALSDQSHFTWGTGNHTSSPIPCGAIGPEKYLTQLRGLIDNTEIAEVTKQAVRDGVNVILMIGDGLGFNQMSLPIYMRLAEGDTEKTYLEKIMDEGSAGVVLNNTATGIVTCSAAGATALATGNKTFIEMISVDTSGSPVETSLELAEKSGYITGLVTDAAITDATPAAFYAHIYHRNLENSIAEQLVESNIEVIFGGGASHFISHGTNLGSAGLFNNALYAGANSDRSDNRNLLEEFKLKGYHIVTNKEELLTLQSDADKVLGLFAPGGISAAIDRDTEITGEPSLVDMTSRALNLLGNKNKSFFVMIEAGRIDWESHDNDAGAVYRAVEEMNSMLKVCYEYQKRDTNTLLIFTADHETGGLGISYTKVSPDNLFSKQLKSGDTWESDTNPLFFNQLLKLKTQKRAIHRIFGEAKSAEHLLEAINNNSDFKITKEDAEVIFNTLQGYIKAK